MRLGATAVAMFCLLGSTVSVAISDPLSDEAARLVRPLTENDRTPVQVKQAGAPLQRALAFHKRKQFMKAIGMYSRCDVNKSCCAVQLNLGLCYEQVERWVDAEASFRTAVQLSPQDPRPYKHLANICLKLNRDQEAIDCWRKYLTLGP